MHRRLHRLLPLLLVAALVAGVAITAAPGAAQRAGRKPGPWCGGTLWRLITASDRDRSKIVTSLRQTNIPRVGTFKRPARITQRRTTYFQRHLWHFEVIVDRYRIGSDGEIALVLYDIPGDRYMNAYLANPHCLSGRTRFRSRMVAARREFTSHCTGVKPSWQLLGATARITGLGFWNPLTITRGALPNGAELRPIVDLKIVSGCGVG
ncbi:MAG TPA: hypothetical protein VFJ77_11020 [Gaiellaceae bacterium]|nr:hypothetical protein [Gaiellaceae bacterium]